MKRLKTRPLSREEIARFTSWRDNFQEEQVCPYCIYCVGDTDGEEEADILSEKYKILPACEDHYKGIVKVILEIESQN